MSSLGSGPTTLLSCLSVVFSLLDQFENILLPFLNSVSSWTEENSLLEAFLLNFSGFFF